MQKPIELPKGQRTQEQKVKILMDAIRDIYETPENHLLRINYSTKNTYQDAQDLPNENIFICKDVTITFRVYKDTGL